MALTNNVDNSKVQVARKNQEGVNVEKVKMSVVELEIFRRYKF